MAGKVTYWIAFPADIDFLDNRDLWVRETTKKEVVRQTEGADPCEYTAPQKIEIHVLGRTRNQIAIELVEEFAWREEWARDRAIHAHQCGGGR